MKNPHRGIKTEGVPLHIANIPLGDIFSEYNEQPGHALMII